MRPPVLFVTENKTAADKAPVRGNTFQTFQRATAKLRIQNPLLICYLPMKFICSGQRFIVFICAEQPLIQSLELAFIVPIFSLDLFLL